MKKITTFMNNPIGSDAYGTTGLTGLELIIAFTLVIGLFAFAYYSTRNKMIEH